MSLLQRRVQGADIANHCAVGAGFVIGAAMVLSFFARPTVSFAAAGYSGQVTGSFINVVKNGQYINQIKGANAQTVPTYGFVNQNNTNTAVSNVNNGAAISTFSWGSAAGLNPQPPVTQSQVQWIPNQFVNVLPDTPFLVGKLVYQNGTIVLSTGTYGATLSLTGANITKVGGGALPVAVTGLDLPFQNWDTTNLTSNYVGAVRALGGPPFKDVVDAAGNLYDRNGVAIKDSLGVQVTVPGPSFYDTYWSTDYISFSTAGVPQYANFSATDDAGTFEGKSAVFNVMGRIVGDPQIEIDSIVLDDGSLGSGYVVSADQEEAGVPEPMSLLLVASGSVVGVCVRRRA